MADDSPGARLADLLARSQDRLLADWIAAQSAVGVLRADLMPEAEMRRQSRHVLAALIDALRKGGDADLETEAWAELRELLSELTGYRVQHGFTPTETATFIMTLKQPLLERFREEFADDPAALMGELWTATLLLDRLGLYTNEIYQRGREEIIQRQQEEMLELSTPVVQLWDSILALPLIGTLDSSRAQIVTENLLNAIVDHGAEVAIIDITGVPTVDTQVAQHLIKTAAAARLMGAECVISGIRPQTAQTIVHLGVDLQRIVTKANLQTAFAYALQRTRTNLGTRHIALP